MVKLRLTPLRRSRSATINDADLLGWSTSGQLNLQWATLCVDGDPLRM
jgi:hypothetical protein